MMSAVRWLSTSRRCSAISTSTSVCRLISLARKPLQNAANYFAAGLKGRFQEERRDDDHLLKTLMRNVPHLNGGVIGSREATELSALNETLRDDYVIDCQKGIDRWNRSLAAIGKKLTLPHIGFNRAVGTFRGARVSPSGEVLTDEQWTASVDQWLPSESDRRYVESLMIGVHERGKMAGWIAPPTNGIHGRPVDFDYVKA